MNVAPAPPSPATAGPSGTGLLTQTLDLWNNSLLPGNANVAGCLSPTSLAEDPALNEMFVTCPGVVYVKGLPTINPGVDNVIVVNITTRAVIGSIVVGGAPYTAVYDPFNQAVYVGSWSGANVSVISTRNNTMVGTIHNIGSPSGMVVNPSNGDVYIASYGGGEIVIAAPNNNNSWGGFLRLGGGRDHPYGLAYDPSNQDLYATTGTLNSGVLVISTTAGRQISTLPAPGQTNSITYDPGNGLIYLTGLYNGSVPGRSFLEVIDPANGTVLQTLNLGGTVYFGLTLDGSDLLLANVLGTDVIVMNTTTYNVTGSFGTGSTPSWSVSGMMVVNSTGNVWVPNMGSGNITVVSATTFGQVGSILTSFPLSGIAYDPTTDATVVVGGQKLSTISGTTHRVVGQQALGGTPYGITYDPANERFYVGNLATNLLTVVSATNYSVLSTISLAGGPVGSAYDSVNQDLYVILQLPGGGGGEVVALSSANDSLITSFPAGSHPVAVAVDTDTNSLYVGDGQLDQLEVYSCTSNRWETNVSLGDYPVDVNVDPVRNEVFVSLPYNFTIIAGGNNTVLAKGISTIGEGSFVFDPANTTMWVSNEWGFQMSVFNGTAPAGNLTVGSMPVYASYDNQSHLVFVEDLGVDAISIINTTSGGEPSLSSLRIDPGSLTFYLGTNGTPPAAISALATCFLQPCPSSVNYTWVGNSSGFSLSTYYGSRTVLTPLNPGSYDLVVWARMSGSTLGWTSFVTIVRGLTNVTITPIAISLGYGQKQSFAASAECGSGPCVFSLGATVNWTWSISPGSDGSLNASFGDTVEFTAGSTYGIVHLTVRCDFDGAQNLSSPVAVITIGVPIVLSSVAILPANATLDPGQSMTFQAFVQCSGGPCPLSTVYAWHLAGTDGQLSGTNTSVVRVVAGTSPGNLSLFLNVSLNGVVRGTLAALQVVAQKLPGPVLTSVSITPIPPFIFASEKINFTANASCRGGPCPGGIDYHWSLNNSLARLTSSNTSSTTLIAGVLPGTVTITLEASLNQTAAWTNVTVGIITHLEPTTVPPAYDQGSSGASWVDWVTLVGAGIVALIGFWLLRARASGKLPRRNPDPEANRPDDKRQVGSEPDPPTNPTEAVPPGYG